MFAELLCHRVGCNPAQLTKLEMLLLENLILEEIYRDIQAIIKANKQFYCKLIRSEAELEDDMLEKEVLLYVIHDLMNGGDYTLAGLALYTHTHEDVLFDIVTGQNANPSFVLSRRLFVLHRFVKPEYYDAIVQKVIASFVKQP